MSTPAENQQTVEALAEKTFQLADELQAALDDPKRYEWGEGPWEHLGDAEKDVRLLLVGIAALRDLAAQASRTQEWKQIAEDMGEMLRSHRCKRESGYRLPVKVIDASIFQNGDPEPLPVDACPTCTLLARLHDLAAGKEPA